MYVLGRSSDKIALQQQVFSTSWAGGTNAHGRIVIADGIRRLTRSTEDVSAIGSDKVVAPGLIAAKLSARLPDHLREVIVRWTAWIVVLLLIHPAINDVLSALASTSCGKVLPETICAAVVLASRWIQLCSERSRIDVGVPRRISPPTTWLEKQSYLTR